MELLYFFLGIAFALVTGLLVYSFHPNSNKVPSGFDQGGAGRGDILMEGRDFKLLTPTIELILVPVSLRAENFLNQPPDVTIALYYRAIVVERNNLSKFAEYCLTAGLTMTFQNKPAS